MGLLVLLLLHCLGQAGGTAFAPHVVPEEGFVPGPGAPGAAAPLAAFSRAHAASPPLLPAWTAAQRRRHLEELVSGEASKPSIPMFMKLILSWQRIWRS